MVGVRSRLCHDQRVAVLRFRRRARAAAFVVQPAAMAHGGSQVCNHSASGKETAVGYPMYPLGPTCTPSAWSGPLKHSITYLRIPRRGDTFPFVRSATDVVQKSKCKCYSNHISHFMCPFHQTIHTRDPDIELVDGWIVPKFSHCPPFRDDHGVTACHAA